MAGICYDEALISLKKKLNANASGTLEIDHNLFNPPIVISAMGFISGQMISLTNPIYRIPDHFVNKPGKRLCDRLCDRALSSKNLHKPR